MLGGQLCTVLPVGLVAVVLLGIVGGGDVDARDALQLAEREGQLGGGAELVEEVGGDVGGGQDTGGGLGEELGVVAAVVGDGNTVSGAAFLDNQLSQTLGGVGHGMDIHGVHTHLHGAAQTSGAEGEVVGEAELDLFVIVLDGEEFSFLYVGELVGVEPAVVVVEIVGHRFGSFLYVRFFINECWAGAYGMRPYGIFTASERENRPTPPR